jgi:hypothetical protein
MCVVQEPPCLGLRIGGLTQLRFPRRLVRIPALGLKGTRFSLGRYESGVSERRARCGSEEGYDED